MDYFKALIFVIGFLAVIGLVDAFQCFSCKGIAHMKDCATFKDCSPNEQCHARKYYSNGNYVYDVDCKSTVECQLQDSKRNEASDGLEIDIWTSCCSKDHCNLKFDDKGNIQIQQGMECFNCNGISDPADCNTTSMCRVGDVCITHEKLLDSGGTTFDMGCLSRQVCLNLGYYLQVTKRHSKRLELCRGCCDSDKCNNQFCSKKHIPGTVQPLGSAVAGYTVPATTSSPSTAAAKHTHTTMTTESTVTMPTTTTTIPPSTTTIDIFTTYHLVVEPKTLMPKAGGDAKFDCGFKPEVNNNMTITWYFSDLSASKHEVFSEVTTPPKLEYLISNVVLSDSGVYTCEAKYQNHTWTASGTLLVTP